MIVQFLLLLTLAGPCSAAGSNGRSQTLPQALEVLKVIEVDSTGTDREGLGQAVDIHRSSDALLYLRSGLNRLDLKTGRTGTLISEDTLSGGGVTGEPNTLLATTDPNRFVAMTGGPWNCPWSVFLLTAEPFSARRLTEDACGALALSPTTDYLAVVSSNACEGRACGERKLFVFSTTTGVPIFMGKMPENYSDLYWDGNRAITLRYDESVEPGSRQPARRSVLRLAEGPSGWKFGRPEPAGVNRPIDDDVDHNAVVKVRTSQDAAPVSFKVDAVFGDPPTGYRADMPRVFRANDRLVVIRRLWEKDPEPGTNPRRRDQIALMRVKSGS